MTTEHTWTADKQRECDRIWHAKWRLEHPEEDKKRSKRYRANNPEAQRARYTRWIKAHRDIRRVEGLLQYHVQAGNILKPDTCSMCGASGAEAHHPDYAKPLEVVWVCRTCHARLNKANHVRVEDKSEGEDG